MAWDDVVVDGTTVDYAADHNEEINQIKAKLAKTTNVTAINDTGIADGEICLFNATNKDIRTSDKTIVTTIGADDLTLPTSKAVVDKVTTGAVNLTIAIRAGEYLRKGQAIYISGTSATIPVAYKCDCTVLGKSRAIGIAQSDMNPGDATIDGFARRGGTLTAVDCRTTGTVAGYVNPLQQTWNNGDLLFALGGANAGGLTNVRPTSGRSVKICYAVNGNDPSCTLLMHVMENPVFATCAASEDVVLRCGDNSGTNKVSVRDYANNEVASINSDGVIKGTINDYIKLDPIGCMIPTTAPAGIDQAESGAGAGNYVYGLFTYAGIGAPGTGNNLQWRVILPEDWSAAGLVSANVHWLPTAGTASEYVKWHIEATQLAEGDVISTAFSSLGTCEDQLLATPAGKVHISPACTPQAIAGNAGNEVIFRVTRIAAQATASNQDIRLLGVSIKYIRTLA